MSRKNFQHVVLPNKHEKKFEPKHTEFAAGFAPYVRGITPAAHPVNIWNVEQCADFNLPKSVLHVSLDKINTLKELDEKLPHSFSSVMFLVSVNNLLLPKLILCLAEIEQKNISPKTYTIVIQTSITTLLKNSGLLLFVFNTFPAYSKNIQFLLNNNKLQKENISLETKLAITLATPFLSLKKDTNSNVFVDLAAPNILFKWDNQNNSFFYEIAQLRAARMLWCKLIQQFNPNNEKSLKLNAVYATTNFDTSILSQAQNSIKAMAGIFGGVQTLNTSLNTYLFLLEEPFLNKTIDPWGGSTYLENLTEAVFNKTWAIIEELTNSKKTLIAIQKYGITPSFLEENASLVLINLSQNLLLQATKNAKTGSSVNEIKQLLKNNFSK